MPRARKYPEELLERAARLVFESGRPIAHVARDLGLPAETLRVYVRRSEADEGKRKDILSSQEREEIKALRREVAQLRRANEILKAASVFSWASSIHTGRSECVSSSTTALASGSSRSAARWACRRPPTTSAPRADARLVPSRTSA